MKKIINFNNIFLLIAILILGFSFMGCEKETTDPIVLHQSNKKAPDILYSKGHIYVYVPFKGYVHTGYYMRTYKETGLQAWINGPDCYGTSGNCLPEVVIKSKIHNTDGDENMISNEIAYILEDEMVQHVNRSYSQPLLSILNSDWTIQYDFITMFAKQCNNIPPKLLKDFSSGKLAIKQFPEGIHIVNRDATQYNDINNYNW